MSAGPTSILTRIILGVIGLAICLFIIIFINRRRKQQKPILGIFWLIVAFVIGLILIFVGLSVLFAH